MILIIFNRFNQLIFTFLIFLIANGYTAINKGYASNFYGVIRDIVFNSKLISFNNPVTFQGVGIGHEGSFQKEYSHAYRNNNNDLQQGQTIVGPPPLISSFRPGIFDTDRMISMPAENYGQTGCASTKHALLTATESDAMKFGEQQYGSENVDNNDFNGYVKLDTMENSFSDDFSLTFSFRTYYPNGLMFTLVRQNGHHGRTPTYGKPVFVVSLVDGIMVLRMKMSEKHRIELHSSINRKLNDGQWHYVAVGRRKLSLWLNIDHKDMVENNNPKRRLAMKKMVAFIGDIPNNLDMSNGGHTVEFDPIVYRSTSSSFLPTVEGFKGCMKSFYINDMHVDFKKIMQHLNLPKCFVDIEMGVYFNGKNSWAAYDESFNIGLKADISFDFRSTKQGGVLFSMSNGTNEVPSLSIELTDDGSIVASADLGTGPFRAKKNFIKKYELCDGRWHTVKVQYSKNSIMLKIDRYDEVYGLNERTYESPLEPFTAAPLYVGGLPAGAPSGTLLTKDSFHGCMRNIEINDKRKDWLSDVRLFNNVERNACPASADFY